MILGTVHFGNPGLDAANVNVPDVMSPRRQAEVEAVVARLERFHPTHVVVEYPIAQQAKLDQRYADYRAGRYSLSSNEVDQLGLRLAARLGLSRVDAGDWNEMPPGKEADYDFEAYAAAHGFQGRLDAIRAGSGTKDARHRLEGQGVAQWLVDQNLETTVHASAQRYFDYTLIGDDVDSPGANWVANWYGRNLKIFAHLVRLADRPEDRVLIIFGAGHVAPLSGYAEASGTFRVQSPLPLLGARQ